MARLTELKLKSLTIENHGESVFDNGIRGVVKANQSGVSVYFRYRYRLNGKVKDLTLGVWPKVTLAEIRRLRTNAQAKIEQGIDPALDKQLAKARKQQEQLQEQAELTRLQSLITVRDLFERWAATDLQNIKDGGKEIRRMFEKDVLPILGSLAVADVRKGHITGVTDALLLRGVNRMAKLILSLMRQMFRYAVDRDIIEFDPTASIRKAKIGGKPVERDRVLSEDEIRQLKSQLPDAHLMPTTEAAIWIMLSTCCRIGELSKAHWQHLDWEAGTWTIPTENSKNTKPHTIYLSN